MAEKQPVFLNAVSELTQIWGPFAKLAGDPGKPLWGDQGNTRNPIIDAETLLCLLLPEAYVERLKMQRAGSAILVSSPDIGAILARLAPKSRYKPSTEHKPTLLDETVRLLLDIITDYFVCHGGETPSFSAGSYLSFEKPDAVTTSESDEDAKVEVVDVYTYSLTVSLLVLTLLKRWSLERKDFKAKAEVIRKHAMERLTGAMQGLVDSFVVTEPMPRSTWESSTNREWPGNNSQGLREVLDYLSRQADSPLRIVDLETSAFEVGWSWGPLSPGERFRAVAKGDEERKDRVYALRSPYLYFTVGAIDGIQDLFSDEVQASNILDERQLALAATLRTCVNLATKYWAGLCRSGSGEAWPIEDMPWRTVDGNASEYWTLYLLRIVLPDSGTTEHEAARFIGVLKELAQRARITRRPFPEDSDPALKLHAPGVSLVLERATPNGALLEKQLSKKPIWQIYDFSPQLLKACGQLLEKTREPVERASLANLVNAVWDHIVRRRRRTGDGLWDVLTEVYPRFPDKRLRPNKQASVDSWYLTERVVEALVAVTRGEISRPSDPSSVVLFLNELVADLDWRLSCDESNSSGNLNDLMNKRNIVHGARLALAQGNPTSALQRLLPLLGRPDIQRGSDS